MLVDGEQEEKEVDLQRRLMAAVEMLRAQQADIEMLRAQQADTETLRHTNEEILRLLEAQLAYEKGR